MAAAAAPAPPKIPYVVIKEEAWLFAGWQTVCPVRITPRMVSIALHNALAMVVLHRYVIAFKARVDT